MKEKKGYSEKKEENQGKLRADSDHNEKQFKPPSGLCHRFTRECLHRDRDLQTTQPQGDSIRYDRGPRLHRQGINGTSGTEINPFKNPSLDRDTPIDGPDVLISDVSDIRRYLIESPPNVLNHQPRSPFRFSGVIGLRRARVQGKCW